MLIINLDQDGKMYDENLFNLHLKCIKQVTFGTDTIH